MNLERLRIQFPAAAERLDQEDVDGDEAAEGYRMIFEVCMRIRETRNLDKQRGFVNGASGTVDHELSKGYFVLRTAHGNHILVHPISGERRTFLPTTYAYAIDA